jgi:hypothetical protein
MMKKIGHFVLSMLIIALYLQPACAGEGMYMDEPVVMEETRALPPVKTAPGEFLFSFPDAPLIKGCAYEDIIVSYVTPSAADEEVWVFNHKKQSWDQIGFGPEPGSLYIAVFTRQGHFLSEKGLWAGDYVDADFRLRLRGARISEVSARAIKTNPGYSEVSISMPGTVDLITYGDSSLWIASSSNNVITNVLFSGEITKKITWPDAALYGLAFDGENLWLAAYPHRIFKLDADGNVLVSFTFDAGAAAAMTWGAGRLWLAKKREILCIDPQASCKAGSAVVTEVIKDVFSGADTRISGIAWDGSHLLVAGPDKIYKVTASGDVAGSYRLPPVQGNAIACDGAAIWVAHAGAKGLESRGQRLSRFKLRP